MWLIGWLSRHPRFTTGAAIATIIAGLAGVSVGIEAVVRARLDPAGSTQPTRIYTRPVAWRRGDGTDAGRAEATLRRLGYVAARTTNVGIGEYRLDAESWTIGRRSFESASGRDSGGVTHVTVGWDGTVTSISDDAGEQSEVLTLEPQVLQTVGPTDLSDRVPVALTDIPRHLINAIITVEDRRFFTHGGWDVQRVAGAAFANARAGRITQGGSTITQQLARTLWLSREQSVWRKLREIAMAKVLEWRYSKDQILEAYLNEVYLGQDGALAIRGVGRAAQFYFGKNVAELDVGESAMLAGIIRGPTIYSPLRDLTAARARRDLVLKLMESQALLSEPEAQAATRAPLRIRNRPEGASGGRYFTEWVMKDVDAKGPGRSVFTTLDAGFQRAAEGAISRGLRRIEEDHPTLKSDSQPIQAALVALNPHTGEVLALVGGRDYRATQFNRAVQARRQPGSAFKPVVALAALSPVSPLEPLPDGSSAAAVPQFTLASELDDDPLEVETNDGMWRPANYDSAFGGRVTLRDALERSLNVPFARLGLAVGPGRIADMGHSLGIEGPLREVPSLALGASEVTLLELTRAYGVLAAYGYRAQTVNTLGVVDASGEILQQAENNGERVVTPAEAYLVTSGLRGVVERGTGHGLRNWGVDGPVAGKTGTTNDTRDAWFVGYTPQLVVGVWVGFDDGRTMGLTGAGAALPIFAEFMRDTQADDGDEFEVPDGVQFAFAGLGCQREVFLEGTAPDSGCVSDWFPIRPIESGFRSLIRGLKRLFGGGR